jgi:hypothetical protein
MVSQALRERLVGLLHSRGLNVHVFASLESAPSESSLVILDSSSTKDLVQFRLRSQAKVCVADPKIKSAAEKRLAQSCDFALVGSIEHRKALEVLGVESIVFPFIPKILEAGSPPRKFSSDGRLVLGYHGNRVHLDTFAKRSLRVLDEVSQGTSVELHVHYRMSTLGLWNPGKMRHINIVHKEWGSSTYRDLSAVDVGLVPNSIPHFSPWSSWLPSFMSNPFLGVNKFGIRRDDYDLRFKVTSNAGRIYPFGMLRKPVIADFFPSSAEIVRDGVDGFLCISDEQWGLALERFTESPGLTETMGANLFKRVQMAFDSIEATDRIVTELIRKIRS